MGIAGNINNVNEKIAAAAKRSGRSPEDILLVAVTKTRSPEEISEAIKSGCLDIGENKVQEIIGKYDIVGANTEKTDKIPNIKWHMVGHLQRNKVKYLIEKVDLIHSVDSIRLAEEISKKASEAGLVMDVLIQINPADEESKFGIDPEKTKDMVRLLCEEYPGIRVRGLMCMAPQVDDPEDVRGDFRLMKELFDEVRKNSSGIDILSMGMTNDYEIAVEEGSTLVRVGTAIFGPRTVPWKGPEN